MDRQENNGYNNHQEVNMDISDDDDDYSWPVFNDMQEWAYASISIIEVYLYGNGDDLYETMASLVALVIILFRATNTTIQDENQINLDSNDMLPKAE